jgi:NADPH:quinone reductase-like Zn-dependent oxidoreductase
MKAWRLHSIGSIDGLRLDEVPTPTVGDNDVLVRVRALGLNSSELQIILGFWEGRGIHSQRTLPFVIGREAAGDVVEVGSAVQSPAVGDRVLVHAYWPCGVCEDCEAGDDNVCPHREHVGRNVPGTFAEFVRVPSRFALPLPDGVTCEAAAALSVAGATSWHMLMVRGNLRADEVVLFVGGTSGIGTAGIQIAQLAGAHVIATAGGARKVSALKELGVDHALDHNELVEFAAAVRDLTDGRGVDLVYDAVGGPGFTSGLASLRRGGRLIVGGYMSGERVSLDLPAMTAEETSVIGSGGWTLRTTRRVLDLIAAHRLRPIVDSVYTFDELPRGQERLQKREAIGKVLVVP